MIDLQIAIPCGHNSEKFTNFLISTVEATISKSISYKFLIGINKPGVNKELIVAGHNLNKFEFIEELTYESGSLGHAHCLNILLNRISSKFGVFLDSDVAMLARDWDTLLLSVLNERIIMIGSEYHKTDGKMINRPNVITCVFDAELFKNLKIDFTPSLKNIVTNNETAKFYGSNIGTSIMLDTGCEIMEKLYSMNYETRTLKIVSPRYKETLNNLQVLNINSKGEEYHLDNKPVSTHIGRSLTRDFIKDSYVINWKNCVDNWLRSQCII